MVRCSWEASGLRDARPYWKWFSGISLVQGCVLYRHFIPLSMDYLVLDGNTSIHTAENLDACACSAMAKAASSHSVFEWKLYGALTASNPTISSAGSPINVNVMNINAYILVKIISS